MAAAHAGQSAWSKAVLHPGGRRWSIKQLVTCGLPWYKRWTGERRSETLSELTTNNKTLLKVILTTSFLSSVDSWEKFAGSGGEEQQQLRWDIMDKWTTSTPLKTGEWTETETSKSVSQIHFVCLCLCSQVCFFLMVKMSRRGFNSLQCTCWFYEGYIVYCTWFAWIVKLLCCRKLSACIQWQENKSLQDFE